MTLRLRYGVGLFLIGAWVVADLSINSYMSHAYSFPYLPKGTAASKPANHMKRSLYLVALLAACITLNAQTRSGYSENTVFDQSVKLNGFKTAQYSSNKIARIVLDIPLPENTVGMYYAFTTSKDGSTTIQKIQLGLQVAEAISKLVPTAQAASAVFSAGSRIANKLDIPAGSMPIYAYLVTEKNKYLFLANQPFEYITGSAVKNATHGKAYIPEVKQGVYYLCLMNASNLIGINVQIEATAVTKEPVAETPPPAQRVPSGQPEGEQKPTEAGTERWTAAQRDRMVRDVTSYCMYNRHLSGEQLKKAVACCGSRLMAERTGAEYAGMPKEAFRAYMARIAPQCLPAVPEKPLTTAPSGNRTVVPLGRDAYTDLGHVYYTKGKLDSCIMYYKKSLYLDRRNARKKTFTGFCYLLLGDQTNATSYYMDAMADADEYADRAKARNAIDESIKEIDAAIAAGKKLDGGTMVRAMLQKKLSQLNQKP